MMRVSLPNLILPLMVIVMTLAVSSSEALSLQASATSGRRSFFATALVAASGAAAVWNPIAAEAASFGKVGGDPSVFCGTYSDPINHPGGKRTITLLEGKTGDYQLAQIQGGGGIGEPENYILPAVILGGRTIIIDFSPKGGPRDFVGVLDGKGIKFLKDGNRWPRIS